MVDWVSSRLGLGEVVVVVLDWLGEEGGGTAGMVELVVVERGASGVCWFACKVFLFCSRNVVDREGFSDRGGF